MANKMLLLNVKAERKKQVKNRKTNKATQTKYITKYGPSGQSKNDIKINNLNGMNNGK